MSYSPSCLSSVDSWLCSPWLWLYNFPSSSHLFLDYWLDWFDRTLSRDSVSFPVSFLYFSTINVLCVYCLRQTDVCLVIWVISWSVASLIYLPSVIGINAHTITDLLDRSLVTIPIQDLGKIGEYHPSKPYPFIPECARISRHKDRLQGQDHSWIPFLLASFEVFLDVICMCSW